MLGEPYLYQVRNSTGERLHYNEGASSKNSFHNIEKANLMKLSVMICFLAGAMGGVFVMALSQQWLDQSAVAQQSLFAQSPRLADPLLGTPRPLENRRQPAFSQPDNRRRLNRSRPSDRRFSPEEQTNISVYEKCQRSVVNIDTKTIVNVRWLGAQEKEGSGSGWVLDKQGHIVTNYHVVQDSDIVNVTLGEGESFPAEVIGVDPRNDIAVLKVNIDASRLAPVTLGESETLRVGQKIFAIGNPFGLNRTMTTGIISSLDRSLDSKSGQQIRNVIQIDAALNQGNSGGPLLDSDGKLIGMNTAIATLNGGNSGVGFSVPARTIKRVVPQLIQYGKFRSPWLGVDYFWKSDQGIGIAKVFPGGPASAAGLKGLKVERQVVALGNQRVVVPKYIKESADVVVSIEGNPVNSLDDLQIVVEEKNPGDNVELEVLREGQIRRVTVQLGEER